MVRTRLLYLEDSYLRTVLATVTESFKARLVKGQGVISGAPDRVVPMKGGMAKTVTVHLPAYSAGRT